MKSRIFLPTGRPEIDVDYPADVRTNAAKKRWRRIRRWEELERIGQLPKCAKHPGATVKRNAWISGQARCSQCATAHDHSPNEKKTRLEIEVWFPRAGKFACLGLQNSYTGREMNHLRRIWLFVRIVGRETHGGRLGISLAWEVSGDIWRA